MCQWNAGDVINARFSFQIKIGSVSEHFVERGKTGLAGDRCKYPNRLICSISDTHHGIEFIHGIGSIKFYNIPVVIRIWFCFIRIIPIIACAHNHGEPIVYKGRLIFKSKRTRVSKAFCEGQRLIRPLFMWVSSVVNCKPYFIPVNRLIFGRYHSAHNIILVVAQADTVCISQIIIWSKIVLVFMIEQSALHAPFVREPVLSAQINAIVFIFVPSEETGKVVAVKHSNWIDVRRNAFFGCYIMKIRIDFCILRKFHPQLCPEIVGLVVGIIAITPILNGSGCWTTWDFSKRS